MVQAVRRKHHYIYKITRVDSPRYYIGMHSTDDLEDGYFGSGKLLAASIRRHGKEKHVKEILEHLPSREALKLREKELITKELIDDKLCMNIVPGGGGGSDVGRLGAEALKKKRQNPEFEKQYQEKMLEAGAKFRERRLSDPGFQAKLVKANKKVAQQVAQRRLEDPEFDRQLNQKLVAAHRGRKDSQQAKDNKRKAAQLVASRDVESKIKSAAKAREALASKTPEELAEIKQRQAEGAKKLAASLSSDPIRYAEVMAKKLKTRIKNGTLKMSDEARAKIGASNRGKKRSAETIASAKSRVGDQTTGYGTVWMKLGDVRKRVKKELVDLFLQQGFSYGKS
jgi:hypothetical protein